MNSLGIESTAHTFSISIVNEKGKILSLQSSQYQTNSGGIIPLESAKHHREIRNKLLEQALKEANLTIKNIDLISLAIGPGLSPCLLTGLELCKELNKKYNVPVIGINHLIAHLEIGRLLTKAKDPIFVLATGANTQIISLEGNKYRVLGECLTIGIGNALDKFGRALNLGFPAGPKIEELAKKGKYIELPYVVKAMDVEFSGIITKAIQLYHQEKSKEDLCYSLQETLFSMLVEVSERALAFTNKNELLLIGGVAANKRLSEMFEIMCKERNNKFKVVPIKFAGDNASMIAWQGILQQKNKLKTAEKLDINPNWRIENIEVFWK